ncbi:VWA domain-containing protein [Oscillatoria sp. CS-180]|uniref:vWA domain-containing protein n=1 Tax=Oscillatoria sp. CS-180 TaxID=3021720 RepID=UPI002330E5EC|nr:VWA domain-containing protein [Oscillatoria sp. CS-180]MDB9525356.1 VWA domain-containing protein [Oscillatoria sp. CS-180]
MTLPTLTFIPMHAAIATGRSVTLDVLITITPPAVAPHQNRPPLNLGFVLDRSGSMRGLKIDYAKQAITYAIEQCLPSDRLSLTLFDTHVKTAIASTLATDKRQLLQTVQTVQAGSSTALHAGWVNGGMQVSQYLNSEHLNRVILLSDGLANVGETNPDTIANDVHGLAKRGISTTALGVGNGYDEDLLESMARSGDGNFFHIGSPNDLPEIFETELQGLVNTAGQSVTLMLMPLAGAKVTDVLNDFDTLADGSLKLPNLMMDNPLEVVVRLQVPALSQGTEVLQASAQWQDTQTANLQSLSNTLSIQTVSPEQMSDFPANPAVQEQVALLMAARARREAIEFFDQGNAAKAASVLQSSGQMLRQMPLSAPAMAEATALEDLSVGFSRGASDSRKQAKSQAFHLSRGRRSSGRQRNESNSDRSSSK